MTGRQRAVNARILGSLVKAELLKDVSSLRTLSPVKTLCRVADFDAHGGNLGGRGANRERIGSHTDSSSNAWPSQTYIVIGDSGVEQQVKEASAMPRVARDRPYC